MKTYVSNKFAALVALILAACASFKTMFESAPASDDISIGSAAFMPVRAEGNPLVAELLKVCGAASESDAIRSVGRFNTFIEGVRAVLGTDHLENALATMRTHADGVKRVLALGFGSIDEAIGKITALQEDSKSLAALRIENATQAKAAQDKEAAELIAACIKDGRLAPAKKDIVEKLYASGGIVSVRAFCESLTAVAPTDSNKPVAPGTAPAAPGARGSSKLTPLEQECAKALGKSEAQFIKDRDGDIDAAA